MVDFESMAVEYDPEFIERCKNLEKKLFRYRQQLFFNFYRHQSAEAEQMNQNDSIGLATNMPVIENEAAFQENPLDVELATNNQLVTVSDNKKSSGPTGLAENISAVENVEKSGRAAYSENEDATDDNIFYDETVKMKQTSQNVSNKKRLRYPFKCEICKSKFEVENDLKQHQLTQTSDDKGSCKCVHCNQPYQLMTSHLKNCRKNPECENNEIAAKKLKTIKDSNTFHGLRKRNSAIR